MTWPGGVVLPGFFVKSVPGAYQNFAFIFLMV